MSRNVVGSKEEEVVVVGERWVKMDVVSSWYGCFDVFRAEVCFYLFLLDEK